MRGPARANQLRSAGRKAADACASAIASSWVSVAALGMRARPRLLAERGRRRPHAGLVLGADRGPERDPGPLPDRLLGPVEAGRADVVPTIRGHGRERRPRRRRCPRRSRARRSCEAPPPAARSARSRSPSRRTARPAFVRQAASHPRVAARRARCATACSWRSTASASRALEHGELAEVRVRERRRPPQVLRRGQRERLVVAGAAPPPTGRDSGPRCRARSARRRGTTPRPAATAPGSRGRRCSPPSSSPSSSRRSPCDRERPRTSEARLARARRGPPRAERLPSSISPWAIQNGARPAASRRPVSASPPRRPRRARRAGSRARRPTRSSQAARSSPRRFGPPSSASARYHARVGVADRRLLAAGGEPLARELPDRLEHAEAPVASCRTRFFSASDRSPSCAPVEIATAHAVGGGDRPPAGEHREPREQPLLHRRQQVVAPQQRVAQRPLAGGDVARTVGQQLEPPLQAGEDLRGLQRPDARGGELDGERQPVEPRADLRHHVA